MISELETLWEDFETRMRDKANAPEAATPTSTGLGFGIPDDWIGPNGGTRGRLVRLDVAIMAVHLLAARLAFHTYPNWIRAHLDAFVKKTELFIAKWSLYLASEASFIGRILNVGTFVTNVVSAEKQKADIRAAAELMRNDLIKNVLAHRRDTGRKTRYVQTRHPKDRQRRPNKSWQSPSR